MSVSRPELLTSIIRKDIPRLSRTPTEAIRDIWQNNSSGDKTYEDWLLAREQFRKRTDVIPVVFRGGGRGTMFTANNILKAVPNAHIFIYEDTDMLGGMALRAISPFIVGHATAKDASTRDAVRLLMNPRVDLLPRTTLSTPDFANIVQRFNLPVAVDGLGALPKRGNYPYGRQVWDIMGLVEAINKPFDEDGHLGRVAMPEGRDEQGNRLPKVSVIGGNTGRDAQIAFGLVDTAFDIAAKYGEPVAAINQAKILEHGIVRTRQELGLPPINDIYMYRRPIREMAGVKKLFNQTGGLERGNPALEEIIENGILGPDGWQAREGGRFIGSTELQSIDTHPDRIEVHLKNNVTQEPSQVDASLALISTGFQEGEPFRVQTARGVVGLDVGIKVNGGGDLPSTMKTSQAISPGIIVTLGDVGDTYPQGDYQAFRAEFEAKQKDVGYVGIEDRAADPVAWTIQKGPRYRMDKELIKFEKN